MIDIYFLFALLVLPSSCTTQIFPDIAFNGRSLTKKGTVIFELKCTTIFPSLGCATEMQVDKTTYDNIRFTDNSCHHKHGKCSHDICNCSDNCRAFSLNISASFGMRNRTFTCDSRQKFESFIFKTTVSIKFDGKDFIIVEKITLPIRLVDTSTNYSTTNTKTTEVESYCKSFSRDFYIFVSVSICSGWFIFIILAFVGVKVVHTNKTVQRMWSRETDNTKTLNAYARYRKSNRKESNIPMDKRNHSSERIYNIRDRASISTHSSHSGSSREATMINDNSRQFIDCHRIRYHQDSYA